MATAETADVLETPDGHHRFRQRLRTELLDRAAAGRRPGSSDETKIYYCLSKPHFLTGYRKLTWAGWKTEAKFLLGDDFRAEHFLGPEAQLMTAPVTFYCPRLFVDDPHLHVHVNLADMNIGTPAWNPIREHVERKMQETSWDTAPGVPPELVSSCRTLQNGPAITIWAASPLLRLPFLEPLSE
jgi:hypothetical protein